MRSHFKGFVSIFLVLFLVACNSGQQKNAAGSARDSRRPINRDLKEIREDGVLRALVVYSSTSYFLYRGQPLGFEYELLERLAKYLDLELDIVISKDLSEQIEMLNRGEVDLIAHGVTITNERREKVDFTSYLYLVKQVLVQKKPDNWRTISWASLQKQLIHDPIELIGDTVSVRENSSYFDRIINLSDEIGGEIVIDTLSGDLSTDEIIKMVVDGDIKYTVADDNLAKINASYYPVLNIEVPISFSQRVAWAVRKGSPELRDAINEWIKFERGKVDYYVIYNKYFKNKRSFKRRVESDYFSLNEKNISAYDEVIIENAKKIGWDWRLIASQIYQESRFDPKAVSWVGARGLMQVMPATARELGIKDVTDPRQSIAGGTSYLKTLYDRFPEIEDSITRIKFTLAAYNCGFQHVKDAQRLAEERKQDPTAWDGQVEKMLLALSHPKNYNLPVVRYGYVRGSEPVDYVKEIFDRYRQYKQFYSADES